MIPSASGRAGSRVAEGYRRAGGAARAAVQAAVLRGSGALARSHGAFLLHTPGAWVQAAAQPPHRQVPEASCAFGFGMRCPTPPTRLAALRAGTTARHPSSRPPQTLQVTGPAGTEQCTAMPACTAQMSLASGSRHPACGASRLWSRPSPPWWRCWQRCGRRSAPPPPRPPRPGWRSARWRTCISRAASTQDTASLCRCVRQHLLAPSVRRRRSCLHTKTLVHLHHMDRYVGRSPQAPLACKRVRLLRELVWLVQKCLQLRLLIALSRMRCR